MKIAWWLIGYILTFGYYSVYFFQPWAHSFPFDNLWAISFLYIVWLFFSMFLDKFQLGTGKNDQSPSYWWIIFYPGYLFKRYRFTKEPVVLVAAVLLTFYFIVGCSVYLGLISYDWFH